jgi:hypothetical protein
MLLDSGGDVVKESACEVALVGAGAGVIFQGTGQFAVGVVGSCGCQGGRRDGEVDVVEAAKSIAGERSRKLRGRVRLRSKVPVPARRNVGNMRRLRVLERELGRGGRGGLIHVGGRGSDSELSRPETERRNSVFLLRRPLNLRRRATGGMTAVKREGLGGVVGPIGMVR